MTSERARASAAWLRLREPADAAARASALIDEVLSSLARREGTVIHDLGCGSGSMARWLAPRLPGAQHWVLHDQDAELLDVAAADPPQSASDGSPVTVATSLDDVTRLAPGALADATLITASALLDVLTADELDRLLASCSDARCPLLISLSVSGQVELTPPDPLDEAVRTAFNAHQRRHVGAGPLLGPDSVGVAAAALSRRGYAVVVEPSPWRLGSGDISLITPWLTGWVAAACEQEPDLRAEGASYARRRLASAGEGRLSVVVHHADLVALPGRAPTAAHP